MTKRGMALLTIGDVGIINFGFMSAFLIRYGSNWLNLSSGNYLNIALWLSLISMAFFYLFDFYTNWYRKSYRQLFFSIGVGLSSFALLTFVFSVTFKEFSLLKPVFLLATFIQFIFFIIVHSLIWRLQISLKGRKNVVIIGEDTDAASLINEKFINHAQEWFNVRERLTSKEAKETSSFNAKADVVIISSNLTNQEKNKFMSLALRQGKEVLLIPEPNDLFLFSSTKQQIDDMLALSINIPKISSFHAIIKRFIDIFLALLLLLLSSPLMIALYFIIPLTSKGPAIFIQERIGRYGRPYVLYKFRSMVDNAEEKTGPVLAQKVDPRITKFGSFIRATRLDELPQLINVLRGEMSLVGPRPEREHFVNLFKQHIPEYEYRNLVKPGITGMAQVMGKYSTRVKDKLRFDLFYIFNYSPLLDIKIIFQTLLVLLMKDKSQGVKIGERNGRKNGKKEYY